jgi:hypothetical protein
LLLAGCAIHPLPEDYAGLSTSKIVNKIRCEAKDAVRDKLIVWLEYRAYADSDRQGRDPEAGRRATELIDHPERLATFTTAGLTPQTAIFIEYFAQSVISYNFTFDMTELNNIGATVDIAQAFGKTAFTAPLGAGLDRTRQNIRTFTISDPFGRLLQLGTYCDDQTHNPNYLYPITGKIGVAEMVDTFVDLALFGGLSKKAGGGGGAEASLQSETANAFALMPKASSGAKKPAVTKSTSSDGPLAMGDTISFTTKLSGSAVPKVVLTPVGAALNVADASLSLSAARTDVHKVIVGISVPDAFVPRGATKGSLLAKIAAPSGNSATERSLEMIAQQILRFEPRPGNTPFFVGP